MILPIYLKTKLESLGIFGLNAINQDNYLRLFAYLKDKYPTQNYNALYDLYAIAYKLPINSLSTMMKRDIKAKYIDILPCYLPVNINQIEYFMSVAKHVGQRAALMGEIPVGACIVYQDEIIASSHNQTQNSHDITAHAEINVIKAAAEKLGTIRLMNCDLYVTIEPCLMCSGAIQASRIKRVFFGSVEPKTGACISQYKVFSNKLCNHHTEVIGPIDNLKYSKDIKDFLAKKR